jgi:hypothetical protein
MSELNDKSEKQLSIPMEMVNWWEKKRLIYNLIIVPMTVLTLVLFWKYVGATISHSGLIFDAFWMLVWCNVLYTSGWVGGILRHHYFKSYPLPSSGRWFLFILGTIFSVLILEVRFSTLVNPMFAG